MRSPWRAGGLAGWRAGGLDGRASAADGRIRGREELCRTLSPDWMSPGVSRRARRLGGAHGARPRSPPDGQPAAARATTSHPGRSALPVPPLLRAHARRAGFGARPSGSHRRRTPRRGRAGLRAHPPSPGAVARRHGGPPAAVAEAELVSRPPTAASRSTALAPAAPGRRVPERRAPPTDMRRPAAPARCDVAVRAAHSAAPCGLRHRALVPGQGSS